MKIKKVYIIVVTAVLISSPFSSSYAVCLWKIDATFRGDANGSATALIHCNDGTGAISISSNYGSYNNIPINASGDEKSIIMRGAGSYGYISYSGVAKGNKSKKMYSGSWKVKLRVSDWERANFSGTRQGEGNYKDMCKVNSCK
jgi:hypothetical protein